MHVSDRIVRDYLSEKSIASYHGFAEKCAAEE